MAAERVCISVPEDLHRQMQEHPNVNWSGVCQLAIAQAIPGAGSEPAPALIAGMDAAKNEARLRKAAAEYLGALPLPELVELLSWRNARRRPTATANGAGSG